MGKKVPRLTLWVALSICAVVLILTARVVGGVLGLWSPDANEVAVTAAITKGALSMRDSMASEIAAHGVHVAISTFVAMVVVTMVLLAAFVVALYCLIGILQRLAKEPRGHLA
jgi:hypothetical protein